MNHCIILSIHKGFKQLKLIIELASYADIYIHIDKKSDDLYNKACDYITLKNKTNIFLIDEREDVSWSAFSQVNATLNMIEAVVKSNVEYDYVHFISGQDLPIKSQQEIETIINSYRSDLITNPNFINCNEIGELRWRLKVYSLFRESKYNRTLIFRVIDNIVRKIQINVLHLNRRNFDKMELYVGSQWWSLTLDCIKYINDLVNNSNIIYDFRFTCCPDEHFFQVIIMNSRYIDSVINNNLRYIDFESGNSSPKYILSKDIEKVLESNNIFARKFDENIDSLSIKMIADNLND